MLDVADKRWFTGIPSPAAAALVAGLVWIVDDFGHRSRSTLKWWAWSVTLFAGLTMVSNVPYYSFKTINLKKSVPFLAIFVFVLVIALLAVRSRPSCCSRASSATRFRATSRRRGCGTRAAGDARARRRRSERRPVAPCADGPNPLRAAAFLRL